MLVFLIVMTQKSGRVCAPHLSAKEKLGKRKHCDSKIDAATHQNVTALAGRGGLGINIAGNISAQIAKEAKVPVRSLRKKQW